MLSEGTDGKDEGRHDQSNKMLLNYSKLTRFHPTKRLTIERIPESELRFSIKQMINLLPCIDALLS